VAFVLSTFNVVFHVPSLFFPPSRITIALSLLIPFLSKDTHSFVSAIRFFDTLLFIPKGNPKSSAKNANRTRNYTSKARKYLAIQQQCALLPSFRSRLRSLPCQALFIQDLIMAARSQMAPPRHRAISRQSSRLQRT
jgi:hypothetical protein